jgi:hypothetical protein
MRDVRMDIIPSIARHFATATYWRFKKELRMST